MLPGMNPRDLAKAMKRLGIQQDELEAHEVVIKLADKELVFSDPHVAKVNAMGQVSFQITGAYEERAKEIPITEEDVKTVMAQANVDRERALAAVRKQHGDLAAAILELTNDQHA
jgi:nascent polypeptide-associated complex subunit alpha